ncbi:MAG: hypothetical protein ACR2NP_09505 [Pirellulaceae bacterium]
MRIFVLFTSLLVLIAGTGLGFLPPTFMQEEGEQTEQLPHEWADKFDARFLPRKPTIGDPAPEVGGFDEDGYLFDLVSTRGKYTVIVFGCLT